MQFLQTLGNACQRGELLQEGSAGRETDGALTEEAWYISAASRR
jgi:hypothetical protein